MTPALDFNPRTGALTFTASRIRASSLGGVSPGCEVPIPLPRQIPISATILTKNSSRLLGSVLAALEWCDEVVVLDTGSTDDTRTIANAFPNVSYFELSGPFPGFGRAHLRAVELARHDWILSVDSDEVVSPEAAAEIRALPLQPGTVYTLPFKNYFNGVHITTCGWSPERHERLFNRRTTNFCASDVHERVQTADLAVVRLRNAVDHYSYQSTGDFLSKMTAYSRLFAEQNCGRKKSGPFKAVTRSLWAFFKSYVIERGFLQGAEGITISAYKSQVVFWKYLLLHEANRQRASRQADGNPPANPELTARLRPPT